MHKLLLALTLLVSASAFAEWDRYGSVQLQGPWTGSPYAMVCNVNGPDGFLSVRSCASTSCRVERSLLRLAIVQVDRTSVDRGWVWVSTAFRDTDEWGNPLGYRKSVHVQGWAHTNYLCNFAY